MTGPDRIWIDRHGGNWSPVDGGTQDVEYTRRDPAVLAALPEVQAMIAAAYEAAERNLRAYCVSQVFKETLTEQLCSAIGTPADATARILATIQPDPEARQADLAKAWTMGRDAAAAWHTMQAETAMGALCCGSDNYEIRRAGRVSDMHRGHSEAIRALTPPADLAAKIGGE